MTDDFQESPTNIFILPRRRYIDRYLSLSCFFFANSSRRLVCFFLINKSKVEMRARLINKVDVRWVMKVVFEKKGILTLE